MSNQSIIFLQFCIVFVLFAVICYQRFAFGRGIQAQLKKISENLSDILKKDSDEKIMIFTDNKVLMDLCGQLNRMLLDRQKIRTDYKKQELATKKMLANISHDIRTPLTVIMGYLEIMRMEREDDEILQKVETKAGQVMELLDRFFTLAKLEAGDVNVKITKININERCRENVLDFYDLLHQKEFNVEVSIPEQTFWIEGDKESIDRILYNLLSNAIRYGSDGKYIGIFLREEENEIAIDVVDRGRGIDKEFAEHVFERLYTMEDSRNREIQGNGLGLTIARNLARQMGGDILLQSDPHVKTIFTVRLKKFLY